jgi:flagellar export protein FliJ
MPFRYKLEALLRLQRSVEHQEENRLLACVARVVSLNADLQAWEEARLQTRRNAQGDLQKGSPGVFLQFAAEWDQSVRRRQNDLRHQLQSAEQSRDEQMKKYREARRKREVFEGLKERQEAAYSAEQSRRIQLSLDEAHLIRSFYQDDR